MNRIFEDTVRGRMDELKGLYAELFVIIQQGLDRDSGLPPADQSGLDARIKGAMQDISGKSKDFRDFLGAEPDWRALCSADMRREIGEFNVKLSKAFEITLSHINERILETQAERDEVKNQLEGIQQKKIARKGYRGPGNPPSSLMNSEA